MSYCVFFLAVRPHVFFLTHVSGAAMQKLGLFNKITLFTLFSRERTPQVEIIHSCTCRDLIHHLMLMGQPNSTITCALCLCVSRLSTEILSSSSVMASMTSAIHSWPCSGTARRMNVKTRSPSLRDTCRAGRWAPTLWLCWNWSWLTARGCRRGWWDSCLLLREDTGGWVIQSGNHSIAHRVQFRLSCLDDAAIPRLPKQCHTGAHTKGLLCMNAFIYLSTCLSRSLGFGEWGRQATSESRAQMGAYGALSK